jgi:hypothetical protein
LRTPMVVSQRRDLITSVSHPATMQLNDCSTNGNDDSSPFVFRSKLQGGYQFK